MNRSLRALKALGTFLLATTLAALTFYTVRIWAGMFMASTGAVLLGLVAAIVPAVLLNSQLTKSYKKLEHSASPWNSFFGMLLVIQLVALPTLWSGLAGPAASIGFQEACFRTGLALGFTDPVRDRTLDAFPDAVQDKCVVWCRNVGGSGPVSVVARMKDGSLKALKHSTSGKTIEGKIKAVVGPYDKVSGKVMLCPCPANAYDHRKINATWRGGNAVFVIAGGLRKVTFFSKR